MPHDPSYPTRWLECSKLSAKTAVPSNQLNLARTSIVSPPTAFRASPFCTPRKQTDAQIEASSSAEHMHVWGYARFEQHVFEQLT
ncbi:hypothetical protein T265_03037 [Opisthorchis viverrini]|uniref:Uncharacterized protein n=1 Tax=Opisthorchis viverrini TaxID=6198 RepID=A0A074ZXA3_OPIVI|nr:hypothetical protein T265_03037 [Opisthorchis viverrini]KER30557.1 hypothetical protein T265_03037 [Opisthorchis viverrini]